MATLSAKKQLLEKLKSRKLRLKRTLREQDVSLPAIGTRLSIAQEDFWNRRQLQQSSLHNQYVILYIEGSLNVKLLKAAVQFTQAQHEILRTYYKVTANGLEPRRADADIFTYESIDESDRSKAETAAEERCRELAEVPFNLTQPPLCRVTLVRATDTSHFLLLLVDHFIFDGLSMGLFLETVESYYNTSGNDPIRSPMLNYGDLAQKQRQRAQGGHFDSELRYWREQLRPPIPITKIPGVSETQSQEPLGSYRCEWSNEIHERVDRLTKSTSFTRYRVFLSAVAMSIHDLTGCEDLVLASNSSGRSEPDSHRVIGLFRNQLMLRIPFPPDMASGEHLKHISEISKQALQYQNIPFAVVANDFAETHNKPFPFPNLAVIEQQFPNQILSLRGSKATLASIEYGFGNAADLVFVLANRPGSFEAYIFYNTSRFQVSAVRSLDADLQQQIARLGHKN